MTQEITPTAAPPETTTAQAIVEQHPGQAVYETNGAVGLPGDTAQVYHHFASAAVLHGVVVDEGGELQMVIAGRHNIRPGPEGQFTFGQTIPAGAYCIAIVKNVTKETKQLKGAFIASAGTGTDAGPQAGSQAGSLASPHVAVTPQWAGAATPRAPAGCSPTVTPGSNEVAILLPYTEAKRVLNVVLGTEQAIHVSDSEKAGITRAFHHAFQRSGMGC